MKRIWRIAGLAFAVIAAGLAPQAAARAPKPPLIVISLDGFRADYFDRGLTPTLAALAADGVHARAMRPAFPSVTEPNHYTLMTGLTPDHHGIVDNTMVDPAMPGMSFGGPHANGNNDADPRWWNQATPLWVTAQRAGLATASSLWPGELAVVHGVAPTYLQPRAGHPTMDQQVDTVLGWLDLPEARRPSLIRLHFDVVDEMGHVFGPDHKLTNRAIAGEDGELARLVAGLKARGLYDKVNLVVLADHGMAFLPPGQIIYLDDLIDLKNVVVAAELAGAGVNPLPGHERQVEQALLAPRAHMRCWRRGAIPAHLHYGANPRVPAIYCLADLGWTIATRKTLSSLPTLRGNHGYDPAEPSMAALFLAHGPAFRSGITLPAFDNVDVYPLLARVMSLRPEHNDGRLSEVAAALMP